MSPDTRAIVVLLVAVVMTVGCRERGATTTAESKSRPNVLLIVADDLAYHDLGCYGNNQVATPALDGLAADGVRFDAAFTPTALCRPSRWAMYSGMYPHTNRITGFNSIRKDLPVLHKTLKMNGYRTGVVGKAALLHQTGHLDYQTQARTISEAGPRGFSGGDVQQAAKETETFLGVAGDEPWFLMIGFHDPHRPYDRKATIKPKDVRVPPYLPDTAEVRRDLAGYYAAVENLDRGISLVLKVLQQSGDAENTIVMFVSDHGPGFAFAKSTLYDAGTRVPMIVRWPGITKPDTTINEFVSFIDIYPTFLQVAGIDAPKTIQGKSFLSLLQGERDAQRFVAFFEHTDNKRSKYPMRGVRTAKYKYIRNFTPEAPFKANLMDQTSWISLVDAATNNPKIAARVNAYLHRPAEELYRIKDDPFELKNLAGEPDVAEDLMRLREMVREWMEATQDPLLQEADGS